VPEQRPHDTARRPHGAETHGRQPERVPGEAKRPSLDADRPPQEPEPRPRHPERRPHYLEHRPRHPERCPRDPEHRPRDAERRSLDPERRPRDAESLENEHAMLIISYLWRPGRFRSKLTSDSGKQFPDANLERFCDPNQRRNRSVFLPPFHSAKVIRMKVSFLGQSFDGKTCAHPLFADRFSKDESVITSR
jgi:hypothetical protein